MLPCIQKLLSSKLKFRVSEGQCSGTLWFGTVDPLRKHNSIYALWKTKQNSCVSCHESFKYSENQFCNNLKGAAVTDYQCHAVLRKNNFRWVCSQPSWGSLLCLCSRVGLDWASSMADILRALNSSAQWHHVIAAFTDHCIKQLPFQLKHTNIFTLLVLVGFPEVSGLSVVKETKLVKAFRYLFLNTTDSINWGQPL